MKDTEKLKSKIICKIVTVRTTKNAIYRLFVETLFNYVRHPYNNKRNLSIDLAIMDPYSHFLRILLAHFCIFTIVPFQHKIVEFILYGMAINFFMVATNHYANFIKTKKMHPRLI